MNVRDGRPADLPTLRGIQAATLSEPWPELLAAAVEGAVPLYVVEEDGPVGYAVVVVDGGSVAYVPELAVDPARQREGYGSRLLDALCDRLATGGYDQLRVTVRADDDGAREFYAAHEFERLERLGNHFETGDGLLLGLSLGADAAD